MRKTAPAGILRFLNAPARRQAAGSNGYRPGPIDFASADAARAKLEEGRSGRTALPLPLLAAGRRFRKNTGA